MTDETPIDPTSVPPASPEPVPFNGGWGAVLSNLLQQPGRIVAQLHDPAGGRRLALVLAAIALACSALYGLLVGSFSRGEQLWAAPLKITAGSLFAALICLPSLYVLACLGGAGERLRLGSLCGVLLAVLALNGLLLVSFAPVAWVFSESTDSVAFISGLHLAFWGVGLYFGLRLLGAGASHLGSVERGYLWTWTFIFVLVNLQMMTAVRPLVGRAPQLMPTEKQFFLSHWAEVLEEDVNIRSARVSDAKPAGDR